MESFPQEIPNESERIDDIDKAHAMAEAADGHRSRAAEYRAEASGEKPLDEREVRFHASANGQDVEEAAESLKSMSADLAKANDRYAEEDEAKAAQKFEDDQKYGATA